LMLWLFVVQARAKPPLRPDPSLTPGDVLTTDLSVICHPHYTDTVRNVPRSLKNQVYKNYHITARQPREYEIDHLISLELCAYRYRRRKECVRPPVANSNYRHSPSLW